MSKKKKFDPQDPFPPYPQPEMVEAKRSPYDFNIDRGFKSYADEFDLEPSSEAYDNAWSAYASAVDDVSSFVEGE